MNQYVVEIQSAENKPVSALLKLPSSLTAQSSVSPQQTAQGAA